MTFIIVEMTDFMRVANLFRADGRGWNRIVVSCQFREQLGEWVSSLPTPIFSSLDVRAWGHSYTPRVVMVTSTSSIGGSPLDVGMLGGSRGLRCTRG